jgi:transcriptional regulator with XRE-family HTH domain
MTALDDWRHNQRMTNAQLAEALNVSQSHISRVLRGEAKPGFDMLRDIERLTDGKVTAANWDASNDRP